MSGPWRVLAGLAALALEALALQQMASGHATSALFVHVASSGLLAEALDAAKDRRRLWTAWFLGALFPVFGVLVGLALPRGGRRDAPPDDESWEMQRRRAAQRALDDKERTQTIGPDVLPIIDALRERDGLLRASAIDTLRDARSKWAVQLLARERDNDVYDVRFRAVESLGRIGGWYLDEINKATRQLERGHELFEAHARLALLSFQYGNLGLEGADINQRYFDQAVRHARRALAIRYEPTLGVLLGTACMRMDAAAQAAAEYERVLAAEPGNVEALMGMAELQLRTRDFSALGNTCRRLHEAGRLSPSELRELSRFWMTEEEEIAWTRQWQRPTSV